MNVVLRLYRQHDMDLIGLYLHSYFSFGRAIKQALIAYVRNDTTFKITVPKEEELPETINKSYQLQIVLNEEKDKDIIEWLVQTNVGQRNSLIKNIMRYYLSSLYLNGYRIESEDMYYNNKKENENKIEKSFELRKIERKNKRTYIPSRKKERKTEKILEELFEEQKTEKEEENIETIIKNFNNINNNSNENDSFLDDLF